MRVATTMPRLCRHADVMTNMFTCSTFVHMLQVMFTKTGDNKGELTRNGANKAMAGTYVCEVKSLLDAKRHYVTKLESQFVHSHFNSTSKCHHQLVQSLHSLVASMACVLSCIVS